MSKRVHVAVAVVKDEQGRVLIARRAQNAHQGGKLEFPGGKVEAQESVQQALQRELFEELGIHAQAMRPLIKINHHYVDKSVCLDVWQVQQYTGSAYGKEGQPIFWMPVEQLKPIDFPAANGAIITALQLPSQLMISPDLSDTAAVVAEIGRRVECHQIDAVILRLPQLADKAYEAVARQLIQQYPQVRWQIHGKIDLALGLGVGLHLSSQALFATQAASLSALDSLSASIHNIAELRQAECLGVDFAVLGPVQSTPTHPGADTLGWACFDAIVECSHIPVYALGGMQLADLARAVAAGAQGVAGISLFAAP